MDAWLLGLIGRPSSGDGFGREVLLLLALCHDHHHRHCRRHVENVPLFVLLCVCMLMAGGWVPVIVVCVCVCVSVVCCRSWNPPLLGGSAWGEPACVPVCVCESE